MEQDGHSPVYAGVMLEQVAERAAARLRRAHPGLSQEQALALARRWLQQVAA